jgi:hypothetical protein
VILHLRPIEPMAIVHPIVALRLEATVRHVMSKGLFVLDLGRASGTVFMLAKRAACND